MITKEDLTKIALAKNLRLPNAEKDYVLELLLFSIAKRAADRLTFKGGTALYKFYGLNRFSEDLDFTLYQGRVNKNFFLLVLQDIKLLGLKCWLREYREYKNEINIHVQVAGPLYSGGKESLCFVSINISLRERPGKPTVEFLISSYRDIPAFSVAVMPAEEMLAEKVRAILTREKPRDIYDLWFLLKKGIKFDESLVNRKLRLYQLHYEKEKLMKRINAFQKSWWSDLQNLILGTVPAFKEVVSVIDGNI